MSAGTNADFTWGFPAVTLDLQSPGASGMITFFIDETTPELEMTRWGTVIAEDDTMATSIPRVFAGGDIVSGAATVILAMGQGRIAAQSIHKMLNGETEPRRFGTRS